MVPDEATKVAMLKTGELDIAQIAPDSTDALKAAGLKVFAFDGAGQYYMTIWWDLANPKAFPVGDVRVRKALSLAINRQELADKIFRGYAEPSVLFAARPSAAYWDANLLKPDPYDPEGAKKLLTEAGYPNGFSNAKIWDRDPGGVGTTLNTALVGYWRKIGINVDMVPIEYVAFVPKFKPKPIPEIYNTFYTTLGAGGVFEFEKFVQMHHSVKGSFQNHANTKLNDLIDQVPLIADPAEKKKLQLQATIMAKEEYAVQGILDYRTILAIGSRVGGLTPVKGMGNFAASFYTITHAK
ncbi:MAG: ABC transporter substrate-binding protein, partial [Dehalococcoidia bacterium]|nr:ABC transporter substrate-binding protein [Dehalococcoidia bacterium]